MRLEDQGLTAKEDAKQLNKMVEEWVKDPPRWLWETELQPVSIIVLFLSIPLQTETAGTHV